MTCADLLISYIKGHLATCEMPSCALIRWMRRWYESQPKRAARGKKP